MEEIMRLQKYIAVCGVASRRKAEEMIAQGRVMVDGVVVTQLGTKVDPDVNEVKVDKQVIRSSAKKYYIMLNKPVGYITTSDDQFDRQTVMDLIKPDIRERLHSVGRLDCETEGLLFLTNDGDMTFHLTHPKHNVSKTYVAVMRGDIDVSALTTLRKGVRIDDYTTAPAEVELLTDGKPGFSRVKITIHEGKNRQVRKMFEALGYDIVYLQRTAMGNVILGNLPIGRWRHLTSHEISYLKGL